MNPRIQTLSKSLHVWQRNIEIEREREKQERERVCVRDRDIEKE